MRTKRPRGIALALTLVLVIFLASVLAQPAWALRVATYNALNWPDDSSTRKFYFRTVLDTLDPDVIVLQEVESQQGVNSFLLDVLEYVNPGAYWMMPFANGPDTDNACFYKTALLDSILWEQIYTPVRYTSVYRFRLDGYDSSEAEFTILSTHLKAGTSGDDQQERLDMTTMIRSYLNDYPADSFFMVAGDFNIQSSTETSYQQLVGHMTDDDGRSKDPISTAGTWHDNYSKRQTFTQSTQLEWGGLDDRFDFILVSYALDDGDGLSYVDGTYWAFGNDNNRMNQAINDPPNLAVSEEVADALHDASDHLPVILELQVPAKVGAPASLAFGSVIVGGTAEETLTVKNVAETPADSLSYSLVAPAGFTAPAGSFVIGEADSLVHTISMDTGNSGAKSGDLEVSSNDLDDPSVYVALSGTVVDHAVPSLDAASVVLEDTLDFGSAPPGMFSGSEAVAVYNDGYSRDFQALLEVYDAEITGGDGRFSFVGGFSMKTAGADPAEYEIAFDSDGASGESLYEATLTFSTRDESGIPGGTDLDDLVVHLEAYVRSETWVPDDEPLVLALSPGLPNPFTDRTALVLSMPEAGEAVVEIYDVSGRRVRTLVSGTVPVGRHEILWDGRDDSGSEVASGVYFCRAESGDWRESRKLALLK